MRDTKDEKANGWRFSRQVNLAVLVQLFLLASLIVGSWVNLQRQLDLLQHDMSLLLHKHGQLQVRLEKLTDVSTSHEYRLRAVEKAMPETNIADPATASASAETSGPS